MERELVPSTILQPFDISILAAGMYQITLMQAHSRNNTIDKEIKCFRGV